MPTHLPAVHGAVAVPAPLRRAGLILLLVLGAACGSPQAPPPPVEPPKSVPATLPGATIEDTIAVQRAAALFVMQEKAYHTTGAVKAVCLSTGTPRPPISGVQVAMMSYQDPREPLTRALAETDFAIVPGSHCHADRARSGAIVDSASRPKRNAMAIILSPVRMTPDGRASLLVERAYDLETANGFICLAARKNKVWSLLKCEHTWNS